VNVFLANKKRYIHFPLPPGLLPKAVFLLLSFYTVAYFIRHHFSVYLFIFIAQNKYKPLGVGFAHQSINLSRNEE
jgi:hypothetical protein